jgi:hypothetical protein
MWHAARSTTVDRRLEPYFAGGSARVLFECVCKIEAPQESLISYAGPIAIAPVVFNIMPIEIDGFGHAGAGAGQEQQERLEMPRRRVDLLSRSDRGGQASCRSAAAACRSRVGYVAALRGAPVFLSTKDGPTPIAVAGTVAKGWYGAFVGLGSIPS